MNLDLQSKHAIVCGSSGGIGKAVAIELASLGANITLIARDAKQLQQVKSDLDTSLNQTHDYIVADFSDPERLCNLISEYVASHPPVHILINNTGGPAPGTTIDADTDLFEAAFKQHLICNQILTKAVVPGMISAGYGRIINIISISVKQPIPGLGVSNTIRGAVASWAKTMSNELGQHSITVNNVLPGFTDTNRLRSLIRTVAKCDNLTEEQVEETMISTVPTGRFADPSETAQAIAFLSSPSAAYINGVNLPVDGGRLGCL